MEERLTWEALAERCAGLEKRCGELESYREICERDLRGCLLLTCYLDRGAGFSEDDKLTCFLKAPADGTVSFHFSLPDGVKRLRLDPGEERCVIGGLRLDREDWKAVPPERHMTELGQGVYLCADGDPQFLITSPAGFREGDVLGGSLRVSPMDRMSCGAVLDLLDRLRKDGESAREAARLAEEEKGALRDAAAKADLAREEALGRMADAEERAENVTRVLEETVREKTGLERQLAVRTEEHRAAAEELGRAYASRSWRLTAPLRALKRLFRG